MVNAGRPRARSTSTWTGSALTPDSAAHVTVVCMAKSPKQGPCLFVHGWQSKTRRAVPGGEVCRTGEKIGGRRRSPVRSPISSGDRGVVAGYVL